MNHMHMKRFLTLFFLLLLSGALYAQKSTDNTLKFLGLPVDGTEQQMIAGLKEKGFRYNSAQGYLTGQFNGESVDVYIHTNHNLVDRIYVSFPSTSSESDIRNKFNRLISQFENNSKYTSFMTTNEPIPTDEDISYEMSVNDKRYQASYRYINPDIDQNYLMREMMEAVVAATPEDKAEDVKAALESYINSTDEERQEIDVQTSELLKSLGEAEWSPESLQMMIAVMKKVESLLTGEVWFMIHRTYGRYNIGLYYDNLANRANGEDL